MDDWRKRAECLTEDPELFFPVGTAGPLVEDQVQRAKAVCARCPVRATCFDRAMANRSEAGIWGGTTEDERTAIRAKEQRRRSLARAKERIQAAADSVPAALTA